MSGGLTPMTGVTGVRPSYIINAWLAPPATNTARDWMRAARPTPPSRARTSGSARRGWRPSAPSSWWRSWPGPGSFHAWWLLAPLLALAVLIQRHDRVVRARDAAARAVAFYERGLARIEDRWIGTGTPGERFIDDRHLYANDLDLFGRGSLFELLAIARTHAGQDALAAWLQAPASHSRDPRTSAGDHRAD